MKKALIAVAMACSLCLFASCGSGTQPGSSSGSTLEERSASAPEPMDIQLGSETLDYHGVHMTLPDSMIIYDDGDDIDNGIVSLNDTSIPESGEISLTVYSEGAADLFSVETLDPETYTPEAALFNFAEGSFEGRVAEQEMHRVMVGGTYALVRYWDWDVAETYATIVDLVLKDEVIEITFMDKYNLYGDVIQQCIDSITIDEECIPDVATRLSPEGLQAAGLRTQAWEAYGLYMNVPEGYTLIDLGDDNLVWGAPEGQTYFAVQQTDTAILQAMVYAPEEAEQILVDGLSANPSFVELSGYSVGTLNSMLALNYQYRAVDSSGVEYIAYVLVVQPYQYSDMAVSVLSFCYSNEALDLMSNMQQTIRVADGWVGDGLVEDEPVPVDEL
ncbi:hypothetical protein [Slackia heliotrinireducens]|uniref:hypothetical protein n=1 Tax=Slackia heliotrinireducens TaxID=84110 RepID=UPI0033148B63